MKQFIYSPLTGTALVGPVPCKEEHYRRPAFADREWLFNPWTGDQRSPFELFDDPHGVQLCKDASRNGPLSVLDQHIGDDFAEPHMLKPPKATVIHPPKTGAGVVYLHVDCVELKVFGTCTREAMAKLREFIGGMLEHRQFD